ncbi:uncharacterized protein LOC124622540 [Schistocerca americana]|uniref:uncharacterized protein LOC124622540 n=1 Tax=Schistocerca americana TaxID=7009 RepID=UPI001F503B18|nr:uncharacterized protein LOC124622540 [Schistocerca americana]
MNYRLRGLLMNWAGAVEIVPPARLLIRALCKTEIGLASSAPRSPFSLCSMQWPEMMLRPFSCQIREVVLDNLKEARNVKNFWFHKICSESPNRNLQIISSI